MDGPVEEAAVEEVAESLDGLPIDRVLIRYDGNLKLSYHRISGRRYCYLEDDSNGWEGQPGPWPVTYHILLQPVTHTVEMGSLKEWLYRNEEEATVSEDLVYNLTEILRHPFFNLSRVLVVCEERHLSGRSRDIVSASYDADTSGASHGWFDELGKEILLG